jgi:Ca2+-binding RTX toxin-like protein
VPLSFNGSYAQNFDTLATTGTSNSWTNDTTLSGWYLLRQPSPGTDITTYRASNGFENTGNFYSYGTTGSTERALGGLGSGNPYFGSPLSEDIAGWIVFAATNNTGTTLNSLALSFNGEQWRTGANTTPQKMVLEYGFGSSFSDVSSWTAPGSNFDWTSPVALAASDTLDGNVAGRVSNRGGTINTSWANGDTLWVRWVERNDKDNDHALAIDDFSLTVLPPDLSISTGDSPDPVSVGSNLTYTLTVNNSGTGNATGVNVDFTLPTGLSVVGMPGVSSGFTYAGTAMGVAKFTGGSINAGANATLTLQVTPTAAGTLTSGTAVVDGGNTISESDETNNTAAAITTIVTPSNNNPTANNDSAATTVSTKVNIKVLTNDSDTDGDTFYISAASTPSNGSITIEDERSITYTPNAGFNGVDTFTYTINDGNGGTATATATVLVNDSPVLDRSGNTRLTDVEFNEFTNSGITITNLIASGASGNPITDANTGAVEGIAITAIDTTNGSWQYTTDGTTWSNFPTVSATNALLLAADDTTKIRFVPTSGYSGTVTNGITFNAWDRITGTNGTTANVTADLATNGTSSPFSSASETASVTVATPATVSITPAAISQNEGNSSTTDYIFTATLSRATTQNVTVNYSTKDGTATLANNDYIDNDNSITFTAGGSLTQTIIVQVKGDAIVESNETFTVTLDSSTNAEIDTTANQVTGTITNDDTAEITITQSGGNTNITEGGATDTYDIVLTSQPTADVTIAINNGNQTGTSPTSLTFTSANWNIAQTVTVTATNDNVAEGNHSATISHTATSSDSNYNAIAINSLTTNISDNDNAGVTITQSDGNTNITEGGATDSYDIVLTSQPTADVTIAINNGNQTGTSPTSLTFTSANWNIAQTVTVTATNDSVAEGNHSGTISHTATSSDSNYNAIAINSITTNISDNDNAGFTINPTSLTTGENGTNANFTVNLNSQPTGDVTLNLSSSNTAEGTIDKSSLTFTAGNWNTAQTVTITGTDDNLADGDKTYQIITAAATSTDSNYNNLNPVDINVTNTDNDTPGFTITPTKLTTGENGTTATFAVKLNTQPTGDVILGLSSSDPAEGTIDKSSLTFTASNWNTAQTVTISGKDENIVDGDKAYQIITAAATSTDSNYNNVNPVDINVTNTDNDSVNVSINPSAIAQLEGNNGVTAYTFTVNLSNPSNVPVTVAYNTDNGSAIAFTDYIDNDSAIAFNPGETSKSITVYVIGDIIPETDETFAVNLTSATNATLNSITNQSIGLIISDDLEENCFCKQIVYPNLDERSQSLLNPVDSTTNGTANNDILIGNDISKAINGLDGDDWLFGKAGKDNLYGNGGNDTAFGGSDRDFILGNEGDDLLNGNTGNDVLNGNQGNDTVRGGQNHDFLRGGQNNDLIWGDKGDDTLGGDKGNDTVFGGNGELVGGDVQGRDLLFGGSGDDLLNGNQDKDTLFGEDGNDTVRGGKDDDIVVGNAGNDLLFGDLGNDSLCGQAGNDTIFGGNGSSIPVGANSQQDCICGGEGHDLLFGNEGEDKLNGEEGNDTLMGGKDNDTLTGGADNDRLIGDLGNDILAGGIGSDRFVLLPGKDTDTIRDFEDGIDLLEIGGNLSFAQLSIIQSNNTTFINVTQTGELLAILNGVQANLITQQDFTFVG